MTSRKWLLFLLLAVPAFGFGVSRAIHAHLRSQLESALQEKYGEMTSEQLAAATVDRLCEDTSLSSSTFCDTNASVALVASASIWAAVVGIGLLVLIWTLGRLSQNNRSLLVYAFRPGLYFTVLVLVGLIVTHAAIAMASIYFGESALTNRVHVGIILAIGLGAVGGSLAMARGAFSFVRKAQVTAIGKAITRSDAPELWRAVDGAASKLGSLKPDHIVLGLDTNFFVTEAEVRSLSGTLHGRTLYCSLPLARILSADEFLSVIGHELGHFRGNDTKFSERFYPIYRGTASALTAVQSAGGDGAGVLSLLPAIATLSYFFECFSVAESRLSRDREYEADRAGAELTSASTIATALVKVHAFAGIWGEFDTASAKLLREGKAYTNASTLFASAVARNASPAALDGIAEIQQAHPIDSHPPLAARLGSLKQELSSVSSGALVVTPSDSIVSLIPAVEELEEDITDAYQVLLARRLGIQIPALDESNPDA